MSTLTDLLLEVSCKLYVLYSESLNTNVSGDETIRLTLKSSKTFMSLSEIQH
jgi:hypothetical protein